jgi:hypothetical protein
MEGMMEREHDWGRAYGGCCLFVWGCKLRDTNNTKIKYVMALDGHVTIFHTQQPTKNRWAQQRRLRGRGGTRRGMRRGALFHYFSSNYKAIDQKDKIIC